MSAPPSIWQRFKNLKSLRMPFVELSEELLAGVTAISSLETLSYDSSRLIDELRVLLAPTALPNLCALRASASGSWEEHLDDILDILRARGSAAANFEQLTFCWGEITRDQWEQIAEICPRFRPRKEIRFDLQNPADLALVKKSCSSWRRLTADEGADITSEAELEMFAELSVRASFMRLDQTDFLLKGSAPLGRFLNLKRLVAFSVAVWPEEMVWPPNLDSLSIHISAIPDDPTVPNLFLKSFQQLRRLRELDFTASQNFLTRSAIVGILADIPSLESINLRVVEATGHKVSNPEFVPFSHPNLAAVPSAVGQYVLVPIDAPKLAFHRRDWLCEELDDILKAKALPNLSLLGTDAYAIHHPEGIAPFVAEFKESLNYVAITHRVPREVVTSLCAATRLRGLQFRLTFSQETISLIFRSLPLLSDFQTDGLSVTDFSWLQHKLLSCFKVDRLTTSGLSLKVSADTLPAIRSVSLPDGIAEISLVGVPALRELWIGPLLPDEKKKHELSLKICDCPLLEKVALTSISLKALECNNNPSLFELSLAELQNAVVIK